MLERIISAHSSATSTTARRLLLPLLSQGLDFDLAQARIP